MTCLYRVNWTIKTTTLDLENPEWLLGVCHELSNGLGLTVLKEDFARYPERGITAFLVISQSHLSIHTWPEFGLAYIDLLSSKEIKERDLKPLVEIFEARKVEIVNEQLSRTSLL